MLNNSKKIYLNHSPLFSLPILNSFLYYLQLYLYKKGLIVQLFFSRKDNKIKNLLIAELNKKEIIIICTSYKLFSSLKKLKGRIILNFHVDGINKISQDDAYSIMWSLVYADAVTDKTKKSLHGLIPEDFAVQRNVVIPYHDRFDVVCDYVFQTAKILNQKGYGVYLIAYQYPQTLFSLFAKKKKQLNGVKFYHPFKIFFPKLESIALFKKINSYFSFWLIKNFIKKQQFPIVWCFEHQDLELVKSIRTQAITIYDCVDYIYTIDPKINQEARKREEELIVLVNYFFVISRVLFKIKSEIRVPDLEVVQGFDLESFEDNKYSDTEKKQVERIEKFFSTIRKPIVGFVGNLNYRMDFALLDSLIKKMPEIAFVFTDSILSVFKEDIFIETERKLKKIRNYPNVYLTDKITNKKLIKKLVSYFDIGMIPYNVNLDFNKYCYPMKLFEYFYAGKPVISTPIEELRRFIGFVEIGKNADDWSKLIKRTISRSWPEDKKRQMMSFAVNNSWNNKITQIIDYIS